MQAYSTSVCSGKLNLNPMFPIRLRSWFAWAVVMTSLHTVLSFTVWVGLQKHPPAVFSKLHRAGRRAPANFRAIVLPKVILSQSTACDMEVSFLLPIYSDTSLGLSRDHAPDEPPKHKWLGKYFLQAARKLRLSLISRQNNTILKKKVIRLSTIWVAICTLHV